MASCGHRGNPVGYLTAPSAPEAAFPGLHLTLGEVLASVLPPQAGLVKGRVDAMNRDEGQAWKIGELALLTGLAVRTLHHYDERRAPRCSDPPRRPQRIPIRQSRRPEPSCARSRYRCRSPSTTGPPKLRTWASPPPLGAGLAAGTTAARLRRRPATRSRPDRHHRVRHHNFVGLRSLTRSPSRERSHLREEPCCLRRIA